LTMDAIKTVTANFDDTTLKTLLVTKTGTGAGMVTGTSTPAGVPNPIACGTICSTAVPLNTIVHLTAAPDSNSEFTGWSGACSGTVATCDVTMNAAKSVTANFDKIVLPPCTFTQTPPVWSNSSKTITWVINNTAGGTAPAVDHYFVIWDGGNLTLISIDGSTIWGPGNQEPVGLTIPGSGRTLNAGLHTLVFSYPNPTSIKGYNFNATIFFVPSNCLPVTTGSWRVQ
jgi:hypothetical protein